MSESIGRYETNADGYVGYGSATYSLNDTYSGDSKSQEHEQLSTKSRERGRVKEDGREINRDEERDWYIERVGERDMERGRESDRHRGDHKDKSDRNEQERDRVDDHAHHLRRSRSEDHDRDRHSRHHRQGYDNYETHHGRDADDHGNPHNRDYDRVHDRENEWHHSHGTRSRSSDRSRHKSRSRSRSRLKRDYSRESERRHKHRSRSRSRDRYRHRSRSRSRSGSKSKRISGFDMPPPIMMPNVAIPGQVPGTTTAVPGMLPNMSPLGAGVQFPTIPLMPVQAMTQQATRHARRVYVGGLSAIANEQSVASFFSEVMLAIGGNTAGPGDAVVNVYINYEKKFAFVEMRSVEEASNAMALDGIIFEGAPVKVRRPSDYNASLAAALGSSQPNPNLNLAAVGLMSGSAAGLEGPDRIFVGGLPYYFTEAQVRELLESFGALRGFDLVKDRETGNSKGYAFCVYQDLSVTDIACAALNGIKMGDKTLTVRRANQGIAQPRSEQENILLQTQLQVAIQPLMLQVGPHPTKVVCLTQVVSADELKDDEEYEEILDDMKGEGGKYGTLVNVVIPRPGPNGEATPGVGRVFLEYADMEGSARARLGLNGRKFAGNQAVAIFYDENNYAKGVYDA